MSLSPYVTDRLTRRFWAAVAQGPFLVERIRSSSAVAQSLPQLVAHALVQELVQNI